MVINKITAIKKLHDLVVFFAVVTVELPANIPHAVLTICPIPPDSHVIY